MSMSTYRELTLVLHNVFIVSVLNVKCETLWIFVSSSNNRPVHWISENYVCPNCVAKPDHKCCQNVPAGLFCTPDAKNRTEKTLEQLHQKGAYCEAFRFISGIDEMALPCEI